MSKKSVLPLSRRHVELFDEDWEFLLRWFGPGSPNPIGCSEAIRTIVHSRVKQLRAKQNFAIDQPQESLLT